MRRLSRSRRARCPGDRVDQRGPSATTPAPSSPLRVPGGTKLLGVAPLVSDGKVAEPLCALTCSANLLSGRAVVGVEPGAGLDHVRAYLPLELGRVADVEPAMSPDVLSARAEAAVEGREILTRRAVEPRREQQVRSGIDLMLGQRPEV